MYAQTLTDYNRTSHPSWSGRLVSSQAVAASGQSPQPVPQPPQQRCYLDENGRLRDAGTHDPRLRYPHTYTRGDLAIALASAEE